MAKFYAIVKGRETGIFNDWDLCKKLVDGYPGAQYKSFKKKEDAIEYFNDNINDMKFIDLIDEASTTAKAIKKQKGNLKELLPETIQDKPKSELKRAYDIYVDGSYDKVRRVYGSGVVILDRASGKILSSGCFSGDDTHNMWNVAGEVMAALSAIEWAIDHNVHHINLYYDYKGIECWPTKQWKAKNDFTQWYVERYNELTKPNGKKKLHVEFVKVKGHSGNTYNDMADTLAKQAINK
jgi:ribonuclease HI